MNKEIRWKQRFSNFDKSFRELTKHKDRDLSDSLLRSGFIKEFEISFELAWKTLKDFLESEGFDAKSPRSVIQLAFQNEYIADGHAWIDALEKRNLLSHTYNETLAKEAIARIQNSYFSFLEHFHNSFTKKV